MKDQKKHAYLAGAIQHAPDKGKTWRAEITPALEALGLQVRDPCIETDGYIFAKHNFDGNWAKLLTTHNLSKVQEIAQEIVEEDLRVVERAEIILCYFDKYILRGAGSYGEITVAANQKIHGAKDKSIYIVLAPDMKPIDIPVWIIGCVDYIFPDFTSCLQHIEKENG